MPYFPIPGRQVDIQVRDNRDGTFSCQYLPKKAIKHTIIISYGGVNTPNSPYRVSVEYHDSVLLMVVVVFPCYKVR